MWVGVGAGDVRVLAYTHSCMLNFLSPAARTVQVFGTRRSIFRYTHAQTHTRTHARRSVCLPPCLPPSLRPHLSLSLSLFFSSSHTSRVLTHIARQLPHSYWQGLHGHGLPHHRYCSTFRALFFTVSRLYVQCVSPWSWLALSSVYAWCMRALSLLCAS